MPDIDLIEGTSPFIHMELMHDPMEQGGEHNAYIGDEDQSGEECIQGREYFPVKSGHTDHRPHTTEDHAGVVEGIDPIAGSQKAVSHRTQKEGDRYRHSRYEHILPYPLQEHVSRSQRLFSVFVH